jgi:urease accessory protein
MLRRTSFLLPLLVPAVALAHTGAGVHGAPFASGLAHPFIGPDHVLAMVAVGLLAGLTGGRARWAYPAAFLAAMAAGGALAAAGAALPAFEPTILASVVVLGAGAACAVRAPLALACGLIALFGLAHGYAHGLEELALGGLAYGLGFLLATAALHLAGLAAALAGRPFARTLGVAAGLAGAALMLA